LLLGFAVAGPALGSAARPLFILGCAGAAWYAWRKSPAEHLRCVLLLFAFAPFLRRLVDLAAGFDTTGLMLVGPLLAILVPATDLRHYLDGEEAPPAATPILLVGACVGYGTALSVFQGDWMNAASGSLKWFAPLIYAAVLVRRPEESAGLLRGATSAFLFILPVTGLYGIYQYVDPPAWDRYWMNYASILSAGQPVPYGVRTYSTMNGPASFATFTAAGLVLVFFLRASWQSLLVSAPAALALMLSMYRTGWLSLSVGVLFCCLFSVTRGRAVTTIGAILVALVLAGTLTPFGEVIGDRFATFGDGAKDDSAQERLEQFVTLWNRPDSGLFGSGFTITDVGSAGAMAIDGTVIACWLTFGIVVGLLCLFGLVWAAANAILAAFRHGSREAIVVGALACGGLVQMPLAGISSGELGVLFWTFAVLLPP
ncbi:O-antigen ligase domain-containing protein, partial [Methylobacterium trifolii]